MSIDVKILFGFNANHFGANVINNKKFNCKYKGLDNAGKTTLIQRLVTGSFQIFMPTEVIIFFKNNVSTIFHCQIFKSVATFFSSKQFYNPKKIRDQTKKNSKLDQQYSLHGI